MRRAAAIVVLVVVGLATASCGGKDAGGAAPAADPQAAARAFLDRYVDGDGRVVRRDQGGDTVSEGQAYAMLLAVAVGDRARFDRVWRWTRVHLRRPDGLLSWHWSGGRVVDAQPAADADVDAAHALLLAARRFGEARAGAAARRMAAAIRAHETRDGVLVAGPWARAPGIVNPSYVDPNALRALGLVRVARASRAVVARISGGGAAPSDWVALGPPVRSMGAPGTDQPPGYGFDAARLPVRFAASCVAGERRLAAGLHGLERAAPSTHPVFTVARAAQAAASGDRRRASALLDAAAVQDARAPTYYGAAWVALGRVWLQSDRLAACHAATVSASLHERRSIPK